MGHRSHGAGAGLGGATIGHRAGSRRLGFFYFSRHPLIPLAGARTAPSGGKQNRTPDGEKLPGGFGRENWVSPAATVVIAAAGASALIQRRGFRAIIHRGHS